MSKRAEETVWWPTAAALGSFFVALASPLVLGRLWPILAVLGVAGGVVFLYADLAMRRARGAGVASDQAVGWPYALAILLFLTAVAAVYFLRDAWDHGLVLASVTFAAGVALLAVGKALTRAVAQSVATPSAERAGQRTLWWPFAIGMVFFCVACVAPFSYRRFAGAGIAVAFIAFFGGIAVMYLGKVLMRRERASARR